MNPTIMTLHPGGDAPTPRADQANAPIEAHGLGKQYGSHWALRDCTLTIPAGRVAALVGPNGAGKTTLLHLCAGLLTPSAGSVRVFGHTPDREQTTVLPLIGFVAQDHPLYKGFSVADTLTMGRKLNPRWEQSIAIERLRRLGIPLDRQVGKLSGGQQAQVALAVALAKRPDLLLLDEPVASLDPLARRDFLRTLMDAVVETNLTVLLSSHIIGDLERVCDYLIILSASQTQIAGDLEEIVATHKRLVGPRRDAAALGAIHNVAAIIETSQTARQTTLIVRTTGPVLDPAWEAQDVSLEDITLAYLGQGVAQAEQTNDAIGPNANQDETLTERRARNRQRMEEATQ